MSSLLRDFRLFRELAPQLAHEPGIVEATLDGQGHLVIFTPQTMHCFSSYKDLTDWFTGRR